MYLPYNNTVTRGSENSNEQECVWKNFHIYHYYQHRLHIDTAPPHNIDSPVVYSGREEQQNVYDIGHVKSNYSSPPLLLIDVHLESMEKVTTYCIRL